MLVEQTGWQVKSLTLPILFYQLELVPILFSLLHDRYMSRIQLLGPEEYYVMFVRMEG